MKIKNDIHTTYLSKMLRAIILDDEAVGTLVLEEKLKRYEDSLEVIAVFNDPLQALAQIGQMDFDVLFLDIEMPILNGFDFLEKLSSFQFEVIFVTAYSTYILNALRMNALDYLLKPVDEEDLNHAIKRLMEKVKTKDNSPSVISKTSLLQRLALSTTEGIHIVKHDHIIRVEANGNYSCFYLADGRKIVVSKTLREFEALLNPYHNFLRVNRSAIVNLEFASKYRRGEGGTLELNNGTEIEISVSKKDELLRRLIL